MSIQKFIVYFIMYAILGAYFLWIGFQAPITSTEIYQEENDWVIGVIHYPEWAERYQFQVGDRILQIDDTNIEQYADLYTDNPRILMGQSLTIQTENGTIIDVPIRYEDFPGQWYFLFVLPLICYLLTLATSMYLIAKKSSIPALELLIQFLFVVSLAFMSSAGSARNEIIGILTISFTLVYCFVLLLKFIQHYFDFWQINSPMPVYMKWLHLFPFLALTASVVQLVYPEIGQLDRYVLIIFVILLVLYTFIMFSVTYWHNRSKQLQILFIGLLAPFAPFLFLYFIPELLFANPILSSEYCSLFLLLLPINVIVFHLTDRLYDFQYYVSRFRYYIVISSVFSLWITVGVALFSNLTLNELVLLALFITASATITLYIKELLDYRHRKVLFSPHGNYMHQLYQTVQHLGSVYKIEEILGVLQQEVAKHLEVKESFILTYDFDDKAFDGLASLPKLDVDTLLLMETGTIVQNDCYYIAAIHEDSHHKRWLFMMHKQSIRLKPEELLWLELIVSYTSVFIENTKIIEELLEELQGLRQERLGEPIWMKKLLWLKIEQEKFKLAQDLHDSILQENISIARQFDFILSEQKLKKTVPHLAQLHEQMLSSIQQLRTYCETLKPPLLYQMGIHVALERFAEKIQVKADFQLRTSFDRLYIENEQVLLSIYRIVQELLHNACKHSNASTVEVSVLETEDGIEIYYTDDGIGCDISVFETSPSLGIYGIQERVHALNGKLLVQSVPQEGFTMQILMKESENSHDFSVNHR